MLRHLTHIMRGPLASRKYAASQARDVVLRSVLPRDLSKKLMRHAAHLFGMRTEIVEHAMEHAYDTLEAFLAPRLTRYA